MIQTAEKIVLYNYSLLFFLKQLDHCASLENLRAIEGKPNYKFIEARLIIVT